MIFCDTTGIYVAVDSALSANSTNPVQNKVIKSALDGKADSSSLATVATSGAYSDLSGTPNLATVATSGSYSDLSNKPTILADDEVPLLKGATLLASGTDLNSIVDTGTYYATSNNAANITNAPYAGAFKLYVERTLSTATYLKQRFEIYNGVNQWVRVSTDGGSTWDAWYREAPHSTDAAAANRFLATPNGSAGLPSYRAIVNADLPTVDASHGGTGETSLKNSANALINALGTGDSVPTDNDYMISQYVGGGTTTTTYHRRPFSYRWSYIKDKAKSAFQMTTGYTTISSSDEMDISKYKTLGVWSFTSTVAANFTNAAFTNAAGILEVGNGYHSSTMIYQKMATYTRQTVWWRYSTDSGTTWNAWMREAPKSSTSASANKFLASPDGSAGLPSYRAIEPGDMSWLGTVVSDSDSSVSVNSASGTNVSSVSLAAGTWIVSYSALFASNATGRRFITLQSTSTAASNTATRGASCPAVNGGATTLSRCAVVTLTATTTEYLNVYHTAGTAINVDGSIQAIRIK